MPEGDSIARIAGRLRPLLIGQPLLDARHRGAPLRDLIGESIDAIETHGKHLWLRLASASIHVHLGMEGSWTLLSPAGLARAPGRIDSAALALINRLGGALCTWAPTVEIIRGPDVHAAVARAGLGPDVLAEPPDHDEMVRRATTAANRGRPLGEVLLDQRVAAGIGNLWKSELCFLERLDPRAPIDAIAPAALRAVFERASRMMRAGLGDAGRTIRSDGLGRTWVYRRADRPCPRCAAPIARITQGDPPRSTYLCPSCQPPP